MNPESYYTRGRRFVLTYDPLWQTLKWKGISQYRLFKDYGIDSAELQRLRDNAVVKTMILD